MQAAIRLVFDTFERTGSATRNLIRFFLNQGILFPRRLRKEPNRGELLKAPQRHSRILQVLHLIRDTLKPSSVDERADATETGQAASLESRCRHG